MVVSTGWLRGGAVIGSSLSAVAICQLIFLFAGVDDQGLILTFSVMMTAAFAIELHERLKKRFGTPDIEQSR